MTTATQNGTVYDGLLSTIDEQEMKLKSQNKEIDRLISENLRHSEKYNALRLHLSSSNRFLFIFLDEQEEIFKRTKEFASPAICQTYIEAASHCGKCFGRTNHIIDDAKNWYDNYKI